MTRWRAMGAGLLVAALIAVTPGRADPGFFDVFREHAAVMLLIDPLTGVIVDCNDAAAAFYGYDAAVLRAMRIQDLNMLTPEQVREEMDRAREEDRNHFLFRHRLADGTVRTVAVWSTPHAFGSGTLLLSVIADVSAFRAMNPAAWHYQTALERDVERREAELGVVRTEMRRQDLNTIVSLGVGVVLLLGLSGWLIRDSRRRRAVEKDLQRTLREKTAATRALEQFTEVMAHHLQEPARRMASYAGLLRQKIMAGGAGVTVLGLSETIESQAIRQRALVRDVQLYLAVGQWGQSRDAEEAYETGDPAAVWGKLTAQLPDRGGGAPVRVSVGDLPRVPLGNRWLTHCLRQILDNALGHSDPDSPLEIRIRGEVRADATVLTVSDNGPGIPEAYRERVFGVFERLSTSGSPDRTGVGLAIVRRIMEAVGGRATARETPGGGTTIVLEFPNRETEP